MTCLTQLTVTVDISILYQFCDQQCESKKQVNALKRFIRRNSPFETINTEKAIFGG